MPVQSSRRRVLSTGNEKYEVVKMERENKENFQVYLVHFRPKLFPRRASS